MVRVVLLCSAVLAALLPAGPVAAAGRHPITVGSLTLKPCATSELAWCATLPVPFDHTDPAAGTIPLYFEWYPATGRAQGTVLTVEGGPGYPSTGTRDDYLAMLGPLTRTRNVLIADLRGTGRSAPVRCPALQTFTPSLGNQAYVDAVGACGRQLNRSRKRPDGSYVRGADLFTTANAARDVARLLNRLRTGKVDLYGDSYGTFFGQTFAARYPSRLRSVTLDAAFPVLGGDPFYPDALPAARTGFDLACRRSTGCRGRRSVTRMVAEVRRRPVTGVTRTPDGASVRARLDVNAMAQIISASGADEGVYRELVPAIRAHLDRGDSAPILRLTARTVTDDDSGPVADFSAGLYATVICNDYPQAHSYGADRPRQYKRALAALPRRIFAPFTVREWVTSGSEEFDACLKWPAPRADDPPIVSHPPRSLPVLVLTGDLDSLTTPAEGRRVAARLGGRWVRVANKTHVTALGDTDGCASGLVRSFIEAPRRALDASCAARTPEVRLVGSFPATFAAAVPAVPRRGNKAGTPALRLAGIAGDVVEDAFAQSAYLSGDRGTGLRGGTYRVSGDGLVLTGVRWTRDVTASGRATRDGDHVTATLDLTGPGGRTARVTVTYDEHVPHPTIRLTGTSGGAAIVATRT